MVTVRSTSLGILAGIYDGVAWLVWWAAPLVPLPPAAGGCPWVLGPDREQFDPKAWRFNWESLRWSEKYPGSSQSYG